MSEPASGIIIVVELIAKLAAVFVLLASPAAAQGLEHGHKLGSSIAYLEETGDVRDGAPFGTLLANGAQVTIVMQRADGSTIPVLMGPGGTAAANLVSQRPCAEFETWAEQQFSDFAESAQTGVTPIERTEGKAVFHRFVRDELRKIYVSYTVTVEKLPDAGTHRVSFGPPLEGYAAQVLVNSGWKVLTPAQYPAPQIMRDEDSIRLELYSNGSSRRVVDYIHVGRQDRMVLRKETPHTSYAGDAELAITQPRLRVNGAAVDAISALPETIRGPIVWIYIPGYGRYVLSLQSHADLGFEDAGEAAGNSLTFTSNGNVFRIDTTERVAAGSGAYTVHVLPDLSWIPADPQDRARVTAGTSLGVIGPGVAAGGQ